MTYLNQSFKDVQQHFQIEVSFGFVRFGLFCTSKIWVIKIGSGIIGKTIGTESKKAKTIWVYLHQIIHKFFLVLLNHKYRRFHHLFLKLLYFEWRE